MPPGYTYPIPVSYPMTPDYAPSVFSVFEALLLLPFPTLSLHSHFFMPMLLPARSSGEH